MPPKTARKRQLELSLEKAREDKRRRESGEGTSNAAETEVRTGCISANVEEGASSDFTELLTMSEEALDTDDEDIDPSFDLDSSMKADTDHTMEQFCEGWVSHLDRDDRVSLGLFLCFQLTKQLGLSETKAAELAAEMVGKFDKTVREWRTQFFENSGEIPESTHGKYQRSDVLWTSEDLNKKATTFIRENANIKGQPNLTIHKSCEWVNDDLLPNETLEPGFPRKIAVETARKWMHVLGFEVVAKKKGTFVDGHECEDVEYRKKFLRRMVSLGFLYASNAPTDKVKKALPADLDTPRPEVVEKTVILFHD